jgi:RNA polymerase sigma-70 factor (ECF subfamily)
MSDDRFDSLVAAYHGEIYRYLLRVTAQRCTADDLSQETFIRAFKSCGSLPPDGNARTWLFAIATNLCRNHFRAEGRRNRVHVELARETGVDYRDPEQALRSNEARTKLEGAISVLPYKQRLAFTMRKFHDLEYGVIGKVLDCSAETARAHVFQALKRIRKYFLAMNGTQVKR